MVIDVNIILAALIRDSVTRQILVQSKLPFVFPEPALHKIRKYKEYILNKSGLSEEAFDKILQEVLKDILIVPLEEIQNHWNNAKIIIGKIDTEDILFVAAALCFDNAIIWSDDNHFQKQKVLPVIKTKNVILNFH